MKVQTEYWKTDVQCTLAKKGKSAARLKGKKRRKMH